MKRLVLIMLTTCLGVLPASALVAQTGEPSRTIHLVYDDSGSMIHNDAGEYLDTWCQARYAMEVVAAMLGPGDKLDIFYMSSYDAEPHSLRGSAGAQANVSDIHSRSMQFSSTTPFKAVEKAYSAFKKDDDEHWLVVLSDGAFEDASPATVEKRLVEFARGANTRVAMLAMGEDGPQINAREEDGIYYEKADSTHILDKLTKISNQIFKRHQLDVRPDNSIEFSVPMKQLIVLAQGKDVQINGIVGKDGSRYSASSNVHASSSYDKAAEGIRHPELVVPCSLNGYVAQFDAEFEPGVYKLDVTGANSITVYFKPNVSVQAYLYDYDRDTNTPLQEGERITNGKYLVKYGLVAATEDRTPVKDISLLERGGEKVIYEPKIINRTIDGTEHVIEFTPGKPVEIKEGKLLIDVKANFLKYTDVYAHLDYDVHYENELAWEVESVPKYIMTTEGFSNSSEPITIRVRMKTKDGKTQDFTSEEWLQMPRSLKVSQVFSEDTEPEKQVRLGEFRSQRMDEEIGKYQVWVTLPESEANQTKSQGLKTLQYEVKANFSNEATGSTARGDMVASFEVDDQIGWFDRFKQYVREHPLITGAISFFILLLIGYGPQKKRLPKKLWVKIPPPGRTKEGRSKKAPEIKDTEWGSYRRNVGSVIGPWPLVKREKGVIAFNDEFPEANVVASDEKGYMKITNVEDFVEFSPKLKKSPLIPTNWKVTKTTFNKFYEYTCQLTTKAPDK